MFIFSLVFRRLSLVRLAGLLHYSNSRHEGLVSILPRFVLI